MYGPHQNLHSFPTRRSSDLLGEAGTAPEDGPLGAHRARKGGLLAVPLTPLGAATSRDFERRTRGVPQVPRPRAAVSGRAVRPLPRRSRLLSTGAGVAGFAPRRLPPPSRERGALFTAVLRHLPRAELLPRLPRENGHGAGGDEARRSPGPALHPPPGLPRPALGGVAHGSGVVPALPLYEHLRDLS